MAFSNPPLTATIPGSRRPEGLAFFQSLPAGAQLADCKAQIDARYDTLESARHHGGLAAANRLIEASERFVPTASSLTLGAALSEENFHALIAAVGAGPAGAWIRDQWRDHLACDLDQAWVRRQYAPTNYPPSHAPHGWHQDGALGFDFLSHHGGNYPEDAILPMVTCWMALSPCGAEAPGLELVTRRQADLLPPAELTDERVQARFTEADFWKPVMDAGDALLFRGDILHRTHVTGAMTKDRTSIELRFFPANNFPPRLRGDRFVTLD